MSDDIPKYEGPRMVPLLDGSLVFSDSEEWRHLCEARDLAALPQADRNLHLMDIGIARGKEAAERLRKTIDEVIAVTASGGRA
jgi:hypothetical protein